MIDHIVMIEEFALVKEILEEIGVDVNITIVQFDGKVTKPPHYDCGSPFPASRPR
jgi:hypothetical protein